MDSVFSNSLTFALTLLLMGVVAPITFAVRNYYQVKKDSPKWHLWQGVLQLVLFLYVCLFNVWVGLASAFMYWAIFDGVIGLLLTGDWFYLGTTAKTDQILNKWFKSYAGEVSFSLKMVLSIGFIVVYFVTK